MTDSLIMQHEKCIREGVKQIGGSVLNATECVATTVLRPPVDHAQDQVYSAANLSIRQGNVFRGQENKDLFFPKTIKFFPTPPDVSESVVKKGWV